jgi:hypothetical protein
MFINVKSVLLSPRQELTKLEEQEAKSRSPEEESRIFASASADVKKLLKEMLNLKIKKGDSKV